ncbi:MAG TPA: co-chaperone GroES [Spirochaetaceae bacterium]|nr:co-chaperone GroES [Spirochaetaceae bacterium]
MKVKPIGDRVLIKIEDAPEKTKSGLFIPAQAQEKTQIGKILAIGEGEEVKKVPVKVGDMVMYNKYSGTSIKDGDDELLVLKSEDLVAVISR